jgi:hypothetical protein
MAGRPWNAYFSVLSVLLLALSVVAFSDNLFTNVGQPSNSDPKFIVHGLFGLAWYVLLATQANLVRTANVRLHRRLGVFTFLVAAGLTLSTLHLFVVLWKGWPNMGGEVRANRLLLPGYAACLWLAWQRRSQPAWHKRLVFAGTFLMLEPVLSRAFEPLVVTWLEPLLAARYTPQVDEVAFQTYLWGLWGGMFVSLALYDRATQSRLHPVTVAVFGWWVLALVLSAVT